MTQIIQFNPTPTTNFQFAPVLDGVAYSAVCTWNAYGCRYYVNVYDVLGNLQFSVPLIPSPDNGNISLTKGFFTTSMIYRASSSNFEIG